MSGPPKLLRRCTHRLGCDALGTAEVVIVLASAPIADHPAGIVQKISVSGEMRCAGHRPDRVGEYLTPDALTKVRARFAAASRRALGKEVLADEGLTRVFYAEAGADIAQIPVMVATAKGLEHIGSANASVDRLTRGSGNR